MNIQIPKSMQLPALITGIGAILFSTVAMTKAPIAGWRMSICGYHPLTALSLLFVT